MTLSLMPVNILVGCSFYHFLIYGDLVLCFQNGDLLHGYSEEEIKVYRLTVMYLDVSRALNVTDS